MVACGLGISKKALKYKYKGMATRRLTFALLGIFLSLAVFAAKKDLEKDITMVSYEQSWLDSSGTLALKNNSSEEIKNVVFMITYLDMAGNELDYEEFSRSVTIAPGMTRKLDIPAYEHSRNYHYYKTKDDYRHPAFKIKFQLKDYNVEEMAAESIDDGPLGRFDFGDELSNENEGRSVIIAFVTVLFILGITVGYIVLFVLVAVMAQKRNRSVVVWILLSLLGTPLLMAIILWAIGKNEDYYEIHYNRRK